MPPQMTAAHNMLNETQMRKKYASDSALGGRVKGATRQGCILRMYSVCVYGEMVQEEEEEEAKAAQRVGYRPLLSEEETEWVSIEMEPLVEAGPGAESHQSSDA